MNNHLCYLSYVARHKWYVLKEGLKLGVPLWSLIIHDWQKFTPTEWSAYVDYFYGYPSKEKPKWVMERFDYAWWHHQKFGPHHWQHWRLTYDDEEKTVVIKMPDRYVREMLADWRGASVAKLGYDNTKEWYLERQKRFIKVLHPENRAWIEQVLEI